VNVADGITPQILNPESVSLYDGLYEVGHYCHAADACQKATNHRVFFELIA